MSGDVTMEKIISLAKRRGFIYPGSEIYGGLSGTWDYGPLGVELKNNIKQLWWRTFVQERDDMCGLDAAILMNAKAWEASGHVSGFQDPMISCIKCKKRFRVDQLIKSDKDFKDFLESVESNIPEEWRVKSDKFDFDMLGRLYEYARTGVLLEKIKEDEQVAIFSWNEVLAAKKYLGVLTQIYLALNNRCPNCDSDGKDAWGWPKIDENKRPPELRQFNMMFKTQVGASEDDSSTTYLRPETAGGIFVNFKNVVDSLHPKLPFGIAQIGKAFRNEIAPRDFVFRSREFEQMEIEYFVRPSEWETAFEEWRQNVHAFNERIGISAGSVHELEVADGDRAHYSKRTIDFEFDFPFGRKELYGLAYRTDFDLKAHSEASGVDLAYMDEPTKEKFLPHVIEPSFGVDRTILALLTSAYTEDELGGEPRTYLKFNKAVAPIKAAVFPLLKNKPELLAKAREVYLMLKKQIPQVMWDDNGNIGKRYRRQDEIGTPYCITVDFDTLGENPDLLNTVTIRDRDTGEQERVSIDTLVSRIA